MGNRTCSLPDCSNPYLARGFCGPHYNRWKRHGDPLVGRTLHAGKACEVEDCDVPVSARRWCTKHYNNWLKTGEPVRKRAPREQLAPGQPASKTCTKCHELKPLADFSPAKLGKYGRRADCKNCCSAAAHILRESKRTKPPLWARRPVGTLGTAWCSKCKVFKESKLFRLDARNSDGFRSQCQVCERATQSLSRRAQYAALKKSDPQGWSATKRRNWMLWRYGISSEEYDRLLAFQGGKCAICGSTSPRSGKRKYFNIDHDHDTKEVRGLLCSPCNTGIGQLADSPDRLRKALGYLANSPYKVFAEASSESLAA